MSHAAAKPFAHSSGPKSARIAIVGEAFGREESFVGMPFVGSSGQELTRMLKEAGIERKDCFLTNVFAFQPKGNNLETLCLKKTELPKDYDLPPLTKGKYLDPSYLLEVDRLRIELQSVAPNIIIAVGNTATWALLGKTNISSIRGVVTPGALLSSKVLPTFHPASVLRNWAQRPIVVADLIKAERESHYPEIKRKERFVNINSTLEEILEWARRPATAYAVDIETFKGTISCIGFARSSTDAIVINFLDLPRGGNYWPTASDERKAWDLVQELLASPTQKIFQNGLYDLQYLMKMGFKVTDPSADTMLLHHSLYPELNKGLGFLGSLYADEAAWKLMRTRKAAAASEKADDE